MLVGEGSLSASVCAVLKLYNMLWIGGLSLPLKDRKPISFSSIHCSTQEGSRFSECVMLRSCGPDICISSNPIAREIARTFIKFKAFLELSPDLSVLLDNQWVVHL